MWLKKKVPCDGSWGGRTPGSTGAPPAQAAPDCSAGKSKPADFLGKFLTFSPSGWARRHHESSLSSSVLVFLLWEAPRCRQAEPRGIARGSAGHEGWHETHVDPWLCAQARSVRDGGFLTELCYVLQTDSWRWEMACSCPEKQPGPRGDGYARLGSGPQQSELPGPGSPTRRRTERPGEQQRPGSARRGVGPGLRPISTSLGKGPGKGTGKLRDRPRAHPSDRPRAHPGSRGRSPLQQGWMLSQNEPPLPLPQGSLQKAGGSLSEVNDSRRRPLSQAAGCGSLQRAPTMPKPSHERRGRNK